MRRNPFVISTILGLLLSVLIVPYVMAEGVGMVTGSKTGTYFRFGNEIAGLARTVGLDIDVKTSEGSIKNIERLMSRENAAFAIVQSDVLGFLRKGGEENPELKAFAEKLRLIFPFYNEEVHLFANKNIESFADLEGKRVVLGTRGSGNWLTSNNLLHTMGVEPGQKIELKPAEAVKAVLLGRADAMFYVAGKPVRLFTNLNDAREEEALAQLLENVHFVPLDDPKMLKEFYGASELNSDDYAWFPETIPIIAVKSMLVSYDFSRKQTWYFRLRCRQLAQLGQVIRENIDELRQNGHPKWQEVDLDGNTIGWATDSCSHRLPPMPTPTPAPEPGISELLLDEILNK